MHQRGTIVFVLETGARLPEVGQLVPAGLERAGPRHPVALARDFRIQVDTLKREKETNLKIEMK